MKVEKITNEEFASSRKRRMHAKKHLKDNESNEFSLTEYPSPERYEEAADRLAATPVKTSDENSSDRVVGFKQTDGRYVKWDKQENAIVVYEPVEKTSRITTGNLIYTFYKANKGKYTRLFDKNYESEINM